MKKLSILAFESAKGNQYIYDDCSSAIIPSSPLLLEALQIYAEKPMEEVIQDLVKDNDKQDVMSVCDFISGWENAFGAFYRKPEWEKGAFPHLYDLTPEQIQIISQSNIMQLLLILTENCNMRCRYCIYSDHYTDTRTYSSKRMSLDIAKQAVDYYFSLLRPLIRRHPVKKAAVTFYGGEPLLELNLLRQLVPYIRGTAPCEIILNLTTNATLLDEEALEFLSENKFNIALSLDGPQAEHDRNRVFRKGEGTFSVINQNLQLIRERKINKTHLMYVSVYDWKTNLVDVEKYFNDQLGDLISSGFVNGVNNTRTNYYAQFSKDDFQEWMRQRDILWDKYVDGMNQGRKVSSYLRSMFDQPLVGIFFRNRVNDVRYPGFPVGGCCIPGMKIAVQPDGTLDICERVNGTLPIGHITTGLDYDRVKVVIEEYNRNIIENCFNCSITKLCNLCYSTSNTQGSFEIPKQFCENAQASFVHYLKAYCTILENNCGAFDNYDQYLLSNWVLNK